MTSSSLFNVNNLYVLISITNGSFATSGNYYNFKEKDNKKYAHILNPKNGMAIETDIVSVSVYHPDGAFADGLATAIYAMGVEKGLKMMEKIASTHNISLLRPFLAVHEYEYESPINLSS